MPKYRVYGIMIASKFIGEIEAIDENMAEELAWEHDNAEDPVLCNHCANEVSLEEIYRIEVEEVKK